MKYTNSLLAREASMFSGYRFLAEGGVKHQFAIRILGDNIIGTMIVGKWQLALICHGIIRIKLVHHKMKNTSKLDVAL